MKKKQKPTERDAYLHGEKVEEHPAFGQIGIYHSFHGGGGRGDVLYGSNLPAHDRSVTIRLLTSERRTASWGNVRYHGHRTLAEVSMSAAQFAEFITTPNTGSGTPCTIRYINGAAVPEIDAESMKSEVVSITENFRRSQEQVNADLTALISSLIPALKGKLKAAERDDLIKTAERALREQVANQPFALHCFTESAEGVAASAKAEVDAFFTHAIHQLGLKALKEDVEASADAERLAETVSKASSAVLQIKDGDA